MADLMHVLLIADTRVNISYEAILGISKYIKMSTNWIIDKDMSYYSHAGKIRAKDIETRHLEGLICLNPSREQEQLIHELIDKNLPVLARGTNGPIPGAINILSNNKLIAEIAVDHLVGLGLRHFAFLGYKNMPWSQLRRDEYAAKIAQAGYDIHVSEVMPMQENIYQDVDFIKLLDWLINLPKPIGIMACNDDFGLILLQCCRLCKIHVPEEIAVLGVDNNEITCNLSVPALSSIARDAQKAGFEGARLLHMKMKGGQPEKNDVFINATHIEKRQSTNILAIDDHYVRDAIQFIEQNILDNICVKDVVTQVMISRRNLDDRFVRVMGRTVHEVITQKRISKICDMLANTSLTATQIAYDCGFNDLAQFGGYFLRHKGISPGKYRKQYQV